MSMLFRRASSTEGRMKRSSNEINTRDMSTKKKVIRKVQELSGDGKVQVTSAWTIDMSNSQYRVSFSRDNLHVWINGTAVETTCYITDHGYDVDIFFTLEGHEGHIYSDVEGHEMMNYLLINGEIKGQDYQTKVDSAE
ncbi:uncharacterized protein LOC127836375 [Dreissena polymorpha]|nr:uncharacterized protein LOC127836375 [Dreissena polymorpha]